MKKIVKHLWESDIWLRILTITGIALMVAGFILPPLAHIDASVLTACGELMGFGALWIVSRGIEKGIDVTARHHDTEITLGSSNNDDNLE